MKREQQRPPEPKPNRTRAQKGAEFRRRDGSGHLDPGYAAVLRAQSGQSSRDERPAFLTGTHTTDPLAEQLGEQFIEAATSGEYEAEDALDQTVPEEVGGPFVETTAKKEFAHGTDASNIKGATREPFPTV